ncbi:DUF3987 domain-containing protein [Sphingomonas sp. CFBP 13706]|uniref:DUF3987 domain-containing protein n=1 Tax=Sphingomonas sp. CFBP 13706 TaxID=2775314 RepID=UPI00177EED03|nr:DUF3987 domain-containing protein [Sphingomonas sp. CFBP 13706]MBD8734914.1 DUF3987 domain-containing protein [Sphingomonas sp. CFBP 13706]
MAFPIDVLPLATQDAIRAQAEIGNYPLESVGTAAMAIMSFAAQGMADVADPSQDDRAYPLSQLYMTLIPSGDAKSSIYGKLMAGVARWHKSEALKYDDEVIVYNVALQTYDRDRKTAQKAGNDQLVLALDRNKPQPPRHRFNTPSKTTTNGIIKTLQDGWPTYGLFSDEGGSVLAGHSMRAENSPVEFASTITMLYDRGAADRTTGEVSVRLSGCRLAGLIMVQPDVAREFLQNRVFASQGIHARFNIVQSEKWERKAIDFADPAVKARQAALARRIDTFTNRIEAMLSEPLPCDPDQPFVLTPPVIGWNYAAQLEGVKINAECIRRADLQDETYWKRLFEHVCRTAGVLAAFEGEANITVDILKAAWALVQFYADQWKNLDLEVGSERDTTHAIYVEKVMKALRLKGPTTARDISRHVLRGVNSDVRDKVLAGMAKDGLIEAYETVNGNITTSGYTVK